MRLAHLLISLPFLAGASMLVQPIGAANAQGMNAEQATQLLAKSHAINLKCSVLDANKSQDLKDFIARAEISLAEKSSVATARKAISSGKLQGGNAVCDDAARKLVNDVLAAASAAATIQIADGTKTIEPEVKPEPSVAAAEPVPPKAEEQAVAVVEPEPVVAQTKVSQPLKKLQPKKVVAAKKPVIKKPIATVASTKKLLKVKSKGLGTYAAVVEKYYVARRCGNMSASAINGLYGKVLANHKQAMATSRARDVRAALQAAEARAGGKSCG